MPKKKKTGVARMTELGHVKVEVWFSKSQVEALDNMARVFNTKRATLVRRFANFLVACGPVTAKPAANCVND